MDWSDHDDRMELLRHISLIFSTTALTISFDVDTGGALMREMPLWVRALIGFVFGVILGWFI